MQQVEAGAEADFKNGARHVSDAPPSLVRDRLRVHGEVDDVGKQAVFVEAHNQIAVCPSPEPVPPMPVESTG